VRPEGSNLEAQRADSRDGVLGEGQPAKMFFFLHSRGAIWPLLVLVGAKLGGHGPLPPLNPPLHVSTIFSTMISDWVDNMYDMIFFQVA